MILSQIVSTVVPGRIGSDPGVRVERATDGQLHDLVDGASPLPPRGALSGIEELPDVTGHVPEAQRANVAVERADGQRPMRFPMGPVAVAFDELVAPRIWAPVGTAIGHLPLRQGGKPKSIEVAERHGVEPGNPRHWEVGIGPQIVASPLVLVPQPRLRQETGELGPGHRKARHFDLRQPPAH